LETQALAGNIASFAQMGSHVSESNPEKELQNKNMLRPLSKPDRLAAKTHGKKKPMVEKCCQHLQRLCEACGDEH